MFYLFAYLIAIISNELELHCTSTTKRKKKGKKKSTTYIQPTNLISMENTEDALPTKGDLNTSFSNNTIKNPIGNKTFPCLTFQSKQIHGNQFFSVLFQWMQSNTKKI